MSADSLAVRCDDLTRVQLSQLQLSRLVTNRID
jgi:hypothetical protein